MVYLFSKFGVDSKKVNSISLSLSLPLDAIRIGETSHSARTRINGSHLPNPPKKNNTTWNAKKNSNLSIRGKN